MQMHLQHAFTAGRSTSISAKGHGHHTAAPLLKTNQQADSATLKAAHAIFERLRAELGFLDVSLEKSPSGGYVATRFGLDRELRNLHAAVEFFRELGGQP